jgi:hypothetical protein
MARQLVRACIATAALAAVLPATAPAARSAQSVNVTLSEFHIAGVPKTLKSGAVAFKV